MDFDRALQTVLDYLRKHKRARKSILIELLKGDMELYNEVKEELILNDQVKKKKGGGLKIIDHKEESPIQSLVEGDSIASSGKFRSESGKVYRIFISYGREDAEELAIKLYWDLKDDGNLVWLDKFDLLSGASWEEQIEKAIRSHDVFISLLSPHAVRRPEGVCLDEISYARSHSRKIVPVMVIHCRPPLSIYQLDWVDFKEWREEHNYSRSLHRVENALHSQASVEGSYARVFANLKPLDFGVDIARMIKDFTGRKWLLKKVDKWLLRADSRVFFLTGDPGIGKSSILAQLASKHPQVMAYHFCISSLADSLNPDSFVRSIAAQLSTQLEGYHELVSQLNFDHLSRLDPGTLFRRLIADPLKSIVLNERVVLVIDALDEAWDKSGNNIVRVIQERLEDLPDMVKIIVSSRKDDDIFDLLSRYIPYKLDPDLEDNEQDISEYLDNKFLEAEIRAKLSGTPSDISYIKEEIIKKSEGNFLYIKQFIYGIESGQIDINNVASFPKGLVGIYISFFDRVFSGEEEFDDYRPLLEVVSCLKAPFNAHELAPIVELTEFEISGKMRTLSAFFREREGRYSPYHKSITDWLSGTDRHGDSYLLDIYRGQQRVCYYLLDQYNQGVYSDYLLDYLSYHLIEARMYDQLIKLLLDFNFLIQKCKKGLVYELIKDYHAAFAVLPETRGLIEEEIEYRERVESYTSHLVSNPEKIQNGEIYIESLTPWDEGLIDAEIDRIESAPTTSDILKIFLQFLDAQAHLLYRYGELDGFFIQQAYNYTSGGPFASRVEGFLKNRNSIKLLFTTELRRKFNPFDPCIRVFQEHTDRVLGVSVSNNGEFAVTGSNDNSIKLWNLISGKCIKTICPHIDYVKYLDATPDTNLIVSTGGDEDPSLRLWNYKDLKARGVLPGHNKRINQMKITPNGRYVISCSMDDTVKVWDTTTLECIANFDQPMTDVVSVDISLDGKIGVSGGYDDIIYIYNIPEEKITGTIRGFALMGYAMKLSPDNKKLYTSGGYDEKSIRIWDLQTGECVKILADNNSAINCLAVTHDNKFLVAACKNKSLKIWDLESGVCIRTIRGHVGRIRSVKITPDLKYIISGGGGDYDSTARIWNVSKSKLINNDQEESRNIREIQFVPKGNFVLNVSRKLIQIRDPLSGELRNELVGHMSQINKVLVTSDGTQVFSASTDNDIRSWDPISNICTGILKGHTEGVTQINLSQDRKKLVSNGLNEIIEWDLQAMVQTKLYHDHQGSISNVFFIHNDLHLLSISSNKGLRILDVESGDSLHTLQSSEHLTCYSSPDNFDNMYLGYNDGTIQYWDTSKLEISLKLEGNSNSVSCIEIADNQKFIFSGTESGSVRYLNINSGHCKILKGHTKRILHIREVPGKNMLISTSLDNTLRLWDLYTLDCLAIITTDLIITSLSEVQPDGRFAYGTMQGEYKIVDIS